MSKPRWMDDLDACSDEAGIVDPAAYNARRHATAGRAAHLRQRIAAMKSSGPEQAAFVFGELAAMARELVRLETQV